MLEMILGLSILLMVCLVVLPYQIIILKERTNNYLLSNGLQLLNDELQTFMYDGGGIESKTVTLDKTEYQIAWVQDVQVGANKACIRWIDELNRSIEKCGYAKR